MLATQPPPQATGCDIFRSVRRGDHTGDVAVMVGRLAGAGRRAEATAIFASGMMGATGPGPVPGGDCGCRC